MSSTLWQDTARRLECPAGRHAQFGLCMDPVILHEDTYKTTQLSALQAVCMQAIHSDDAHSRIWLMLSSAKATQRSTAALQPYFSAVSSQGRTLPTVRSKRHSACPQSARRSGMSSAHYAGSAGSDTTASGSQAHSTADRCLDISHHMHSVNRTTTGIGKQHAFRQHS